MFGIRRKDDTRAPVALPRDAAVADAAIPRVDFQIVGAMKCGTTTIRAVLGAHPDVYMPEREVHFFGNHRRYLSVWKGGRLDPAALEEAYGRHYRVERPVIGGKTPNYMASSLTIERLQRFHPDAKIVVMVRNPVDRARSHWDHLQRQVERGRVPAWHAAPSLAEHVMRNAAELAQAHLPDVEIADTNILWRGFYAVQIRRLRRFFPQERVFVGVLDDLRDDREKFFRGLFDFLALRWEPAAVAADEEETRVRSRPYKLTDAERQSLREFYAPSIRDLEELLGRELPGWR
jgi:sulfotransferase family protein